MIPKNWNWMAMFYNVVNLIAEFFKTTKRFLYWWSYGVWKSLCNDFSKITMVKNTCCDMITMWKHDAKRRELVGNVLQCCKLDYWLFKHQKDFILIKLWCLKLSKQWFSQNNNGQKYMFWHDNNVKTCFQKTGTGCQCFIML